MDIADYILIQSDLLLGSENECAPKAPATKWEWPFIKPQGLLEETRPYICSDFIRHSSLSNSFIFISAVVIGLISLLI